MKRSRQLAAIMFTDITGYTALMQQNEEKAIQSRDKHRHIFNSVTEKYRGRILQYYGDGTLSIFDSAIDAVKCGIEMQIDFQKDPVIPVRIGIHTGDIIFSDEEVIGDGVNVASRIESLAVPGSVFISDKVYDEIKNQESIEASILKTFKLKNVEKPIEVYAISNVGLIVPKVEEIEGKTDIYISPIPEKQEQFKSKIQDGGSLNIILDTKLYIPNPLPKVVQRQRLIERMNEGIHGKLTLISAPPGFGKTTLVSEWIAENKRSAAWLSLDKGDNDPIRFITYLVAALQTISPNIGEGLLDLLHSPQPPPIESMLMALLNEVTGGTENFTLVLDDYHVIDTEPVEDVLNFLIEHLPSLMHVVITTRKDPRLPLARLRVRGQLTELRATDLRFTHAETAGFLNQVMDLNLSEENIAALETSTEGWVAGLQMAALSMRGRDDITGFIKGFAGDDRYIVDYLVEEVLLSQGQQVRSFLLQTSILERLSGPLCNVVTGREDGRKMLETLERSNLFVIPLDDKRQWYRYHHLFADVLKTRLMDEQPDLLHNLHLRAGEWYENNNLPNDAVRHTLAAADFEKAAGLIEVAWPAMDRSCQANTWLGWVKEIPDELIRNRPVLSAAYAWALLEAGELETSEPRLEDAERWMDTISEKNVRPEELSTGMVIVDEKQFRLLPGSIATARAYIAQAYGDNTSTVKYARQALKLLHEGDFIQREIPNVLLGFAQWANGELEEAYKAFTEVMESFQKGGGISAAISVAFAPAEIRIIQGRLLEAIGLYEKSLELALKHNEPFLMGTAEIYLDLSNLYHKQGKLEVARQHMLIGEELAKQIVSQDWEYRWCLAQAQMMESEGDLDGALKMLDEAEQKYLISPLPDVRPVNALKVRIWIAQDRMMDALDWVSNRELSVNDDLSYIREFEHITLARVLIARYKKERDESYIVEARSLLERLLKAAEEGERTGSVLEILIQLALAHQAQGDINLALEPLKRAMILAEPQGYVRIFVDEGSPMVQLLSEAVNQGIMPDFTGKLLTIFESDK